MQHTKILRKVKYKPVRQWPHASHWTSFQVHVQDGSLRDGKKERLYKIQKGRILLLNYLNKIKSVLEGGKKIFCPVNLVSR